MSGPERTFTLGVNKHLVPGLHHEGMANPYRGGTPDHWYSGTRDLWIEYKFVKLPKRPDTVIDFGLSALQVRWITQRADEGRNVWVIVGCKEGGVAFRGTSWGRAWSVAEFKERLSTRAELGQCISDFCCS